MKGCLTVLLLGAMLLALGACGGGASGHGGSAALKQNPYTMQVVGPPAAGVQANRPFAITLQFFEANKATPINVSGIEAITATVASGPGTLVGTTTMPGNSTDTLTFNNLVVSDPGTYTLQFNGLRAAQPVVTAAFVVDATRSLRFTSVPEDAIKNRVFAVALESYDPFTGIAAAPSTPVDVTLSLVTGSGALGGTLTQTLGGSGTVMFTNLTYSQVGTIALKAVGFAFPDVVTSSFLVDTVVMGFAPPPADIAVNGTFALRLLLTGQYSGRPLEPYPGISATLSLISGSGNLTGNLTASNDGSAITFPGLRYDQPGTVVFGASSTSAPTATSAGVVFGLRLQAAVQGPAVTGAGSAFGAVKFRLVDGTGAAWTANTGLDWIIRNATGQQVQAGQATMSAGVASVTPSPISTVGAYTLAGSVTSPVAASAEVALGVSNLVLVNQPGTFVALKSVRVNDSYSDAVVYAAPGGTTGYGLLAGVLPAGLSLNTSNGAITGTPTTAGSYQFTLYANLGGGEAHALRCALAVFSSDEAEIVPGQNFKSVGPFNPVGPINEDFSFNSSYDGITYAQGGTPDCRLQYYYPDFATAPASVPVFILHRGRGFNMVDYDNLGAHLASHGIAFVSVEDYQSFYDAGGSGRAPNTTYDNTAERGMESASAFQEAAMQWLLQVNAQSGHPLYKHVDVDNIFVGGHSRGGGATHATHARSQPYTYGGMEQPALGIRGVVYFMAFDMRSFATTASGNANLYAIPAGQARLPSLLLAAENDRDLFYPVCDQFIDRANGPATFATIYGGCHNYMGDTTAAEPNYSSQGIGVPYITRAEEQERAFNLVVAFIKRWGSLDLSLDGLLYNNELAGSQEVGVTAWRNMAERVVVDDHQGGNKLVNRLGGSNSLSNGSWTTAGGIYPNFGAMASVGVRHNIVTLSGSATYASSIPASYQDLSATRRFVFRMGQVDQTGQKGFDWVTVRVRLTDAQADTATITLFDTNNQYGQYLPDYSGSGNNVLDRFVEANVPLDAFTALTPSLNLNQLTKVELIFEPAQSTARQVYFDDLRFE